MKKTAPILLLSIACLLSSCKVPSRGKKSKTSSSDEISETSETTSADNASENKDESGDSSSNDRDSDGSSSLSPYSESPSETPSSKEKESEEKSDSDDNPSSEQSASSSSSSRSSSSSSFSSDSSSYGQSSDEASSSGDDEEGIEVTKALSCKAYCLSLENYIDGVEIFNFSLDGNVPYISISSFFDLSNKFLYGKERFRVSGNVVTNILSLATLTFAGDVIASSDLDGFLCFYSNSSLPIDLFDASNDSLASLSGDSGYVKGNSVAFDLSAYNARLIDYEDEIYVPFAFLEAIVWTEVGYRLVFNGDDFYAFSSSYVCGDDNALTDYGKALYSGSFSKAANRTSEYLSYNYYSFVFEMENFYGKFAELGISSLDEELASLGLKYNMLSNNGATSAEGYAEAINRLFHDGGHTAFLHRGIGVSYSYSADNELTGDILDWDSRYYNGLVVSNNLSKGRQNKGNSAQGLYISGNTAIIRFDSFDLNSAGVSPSKSNVSSDAQSTFAIIYNAFQNIKKNASIQNVVFDVSLNGGGYATALGQALSFMTDDPVEVNYTNPLSGAIYTEKVSYDNDLDGDFYDDDSYAGEYSFYILTSAYSFSCGNAFPCLARENGYAKIIGQNSGGGDCAVSSGISADGASWQMSGNTKLIHKDGSSFDGGAGVDYEIDYSYFSDFAYLDSYLCSL
jgi:hypothetical protein